MRNSLDDFTRYLEKNGQADAGTVAQAESGRVAEATPPMPLRSAEGATLPSLPVQYVLRNGVTIAVPLAKPDVPSSQVVSEEHRPAGQPTAMAPLIVEAADMTETGRAAALWQHLPRHIQLLISLTHESGEEAAQKYYSRGFKESRRELIERLLDPTLTLEDTARVLGVVPATVRRYTNRGVLPHHRTTGQQRRFRLSDVLTFLEYQQQSGANEGDFCDDPNSDDS